MIHQQEKQAGCVTQQLYLQGRSLAEIELLLGFHKGRLKMGASFWVAIVLPTADEFDFAGYTQVAGHRTTSQYGNINNPLRKDEKEAYDRRKKMVIDKWSTVNGSERLVKVKPIMEPDNSMDNDTQYPPGQGIPQWVIKKPSNIIFKNIQELTDKDYPNGRFVPDQGFIPVKYK